MAAIDDSIVLISLRTILQKLPGTGIRIGKLRFPHGAILKSLDSELGRSFRSVEY